MQRPERRFYFRLALALGSTVEELLERISARELTEWMAFNTLEPFGDPRADMRAGIVASVIANVNRDAKKRPKPYMPADFMPEFDEQTRPKKTAKEIYMEFRTWALAAGAKLKG